MTDQPNLIRTLHSPAAGDQPVDAGRRPRADGGVEAFRVHRDAAGRITVRVEAGGPGGLPVGSLWHLVLAHGGRPERLEARWREGGRTFEAALTFFPDEVLVWRRGAEPISEAVALPPGYRVLWPPTAGREHALPGVAQDRSVPLCELRLAPLAEGGLRVVVTSSGAPGLDDPVHLLPTSEPPGA